MVKHSSLTWTLRFSKGALHDLKLCEEEVQKSILSYLHDLSQKESSLWNYGEPLSEDPTKFWRFCTGGYRLICDIRGEGKCFLVFRILLERAPFVPPHQVSSSP